MPSAVHWHDIRANRPHRSLQRLSSPPAISHSRFELFQPHTRGRFAQRISRLGPPFIHVVSDVVALYHGQPDWTKLNRDKQGLERLCNTQTYLEVRLHALHQSTSDNPLISYTITAVLCGYAFWTDVWNAARIPRGLSTQSLYHVRCWQSIGCSYDDEHLYRLVRVGKAFAIDIHVRPR